MPISKAIKSKTESFYTHSPLSIDPSLPDTRWGPDMRVVHLNSGKARTLALALGLLLTLIAVNANAEKRSIEAAILAKSTTDWRGAKLPPYSSGQPEITIARVTIPPGTALPLHTHPQITAGIIVQGSLQLYTDSGDTQIARAGDAVIEMVHQAHSGANNGDEDVVILVVYAGVEGTPITEPVSTPNP